MIFSTGNLPPSASQQLATKSKLWLKFISLSMENEYSQLNNLQCQSWFVPINPQFDVFPKAFGKSSNARNRKMQKNLWLFANHNCKRIGENLKQTCLLTKHLLKQIEFHIPAKSKVGKNLLPMLFLFQGCIKDSASKIFREVCVGL